MKKEVYRPTVNKRVLEYFLKLLLEQPLFRTQTNGFSRVVLPMMLKVDNGEVFVETKLSVRPEVHYEAIRLTIQKILI